MYPFTHLPNSLGHDLFDELCDCLPRPLEDTPRARDAREAIAMTAIADLDPMDTVEATLAIQAVASEAHVRVCLRTAARLAPDDPVAIRLRAQAATLSRRVERALAQLRGRQAGRPMPIPSSKGIIPDAVTPAADPEPAMPAETAAAADDFAIRHPAAVIRLRQRIEPPEAVLGDPALGADRPDPVLLQALLTGTSPLLTALDEGARELAMAD